MDSVNDKLTDDVYNVLADKLYDDDLHNALNSSGLGVQESRRRSKRQPSTPNPVKHCKREKGRAAVKEAPYQHDDSEVPPVIERGGHSKNRNRRGAAVRDTPCHLGASQVPPVLERGGHSKNHQNKGGAAVRDTPYQLGFSQVPPVFKNGKHTMNHQNKGGAAFRDTPYHLGASHVPLVLNNQNKGGATVRDASRPRGETKEPPDRRRRNNSLVAKQNMNKQGECSNVDRQQSVDRFRGYTPNHYRSNENEMNGNPPGRECKQTDNDQRGRLPTRRPMGYKHLEELVNKEPSEVLLVLANRKYGFEERLKNNVSPDLMIIIMGALRKVCEADFNENKTKILHNVLRTNFLDQLSRHLSLIHQEENVKRMKSMKCFIVNVFTFYETIMNLLPMASVDKLRSPLIITDLMIKNVETNKLIDVVELKDRFTNIQNQLKNMVEVEEKKRKRSTNDAPQYGTPPDNFRDISIFPTPEDLLGGPAYLRINIVKGAYLDVEHYLDVQFRLLREDFVSPLREGISQFIQMSTTKSRKPQRIDNVRIYHDVVFENPKVVGDRIGVVVFFDPKRKFQKNVWEYSKRFMFGSLLCFTRDNFQNVLFGTVIDRDIKQLKIGRIVVELCQNVHVFNNTDVQFIMAESEVYFEPYHLVLKALQAMQRDAFPMQKYIIDVEQESDIPKYILTQPDVWYNVDGDDVQMLNYESWPDASELKLDESQYEAFRAALTKEFVVIQGPPGTGKTFLGLKVAEVLLENLHVWNVGKRPMLVVCFTNHALDQFLEGLIPMTENLIRIGGQSNNPKLAPFNLKEVRKSCSNSRINHQLYREKNKEMQDLMAIIKGIQLDVEELNSRNGVVSLSVLKQAGITDQHLSCFNGGSLMQENAMFVDWLGQGRNELQVEIPHDSVVLVNTNIDGQAEEVDPDNIEEERIGFEELHDALQFDFDNIRPGISYALNVEDMKKEVDWLDQQRMAIELDHTPYHQEYEFNYQYNEKRLLLNYWQTQLKQPHHQGVLQIEILLCERNLWHLAVNDRWILYKHWVNSLHNQLLRRLQELQEKYCIVAREHQEVKQMADLDVLHTAKVVGMTTTCAARLQPLLQALKPRIVIVEEAAEVLESHIVVSLTKKCEHLILIGDHQQLRPSTAVYQLATKYKFDISLFERMLNNGMQCHQLKVQHRMRPEIAQLISPAIYPGLLNHDSVNRYKCVRGIKKNVFFVTHTHPEEEMGEIMSHKNVHEAEFLFALCRYLLLQGYSAEEITILATYKGQLFHMKSLQKKSHFLRDVKITVVDNFQGEENRIILLSLVRSNPNANIGFLKIENRVCVALSRAKEGLYIVGNMNNLVESSKIWPIVQETLSHQEAVGPRLTLECQVHPDQLTLVGTANDFEQVPEGGCSLPCNASLLCGHHCQSVCHVQNRSHQEYKCHEPCDRVPLMCELEHRCIKRCHESCGPCLTVVVHTLPCGHVKSLHCHVDHITYKCLEPVEVTLTDCGHKANKPCYQNIEEFCCPYPCQVRLECGHSCTKTCHPRKDPDHLEYQCRKPCAKKNAGCSRDHLCMKLCYEECGQCTMNVKKKLPNCDHHHDMQCSINPAIIVCHRRCKRKLPCGHPCPNTCSVECGNCPVKVKKIIPACNHQLVVKCCEEPQQMNCKSPCVRKLACGHNCTKVCGVPCTDKCEELLQSHVRPACNHGVLIPCHLRRVDFMPDSDQLLSFCRVRCGTLLECGHTCKGTCGQCLQGRIHVMCQKKCGRNLICGHSCGVPCAQSCPPCVKKCEYKCEHSRCSKKCGVPCTTCKERCSWRCVHLSCTKLCYEICNREPCYEPCPKVLKCKHPCIGFCGDPCPPLCRLCNRDEVTEVFFGTEDDEDARFVFLKDDCGHVLESQGLETWLKQSEGEITMKTCPFCKSPIMHTQRYMNFVKQVLKDVIGIKNKVFGNMEEIDSKRKDLLRRLNGITTSPWITNYSSKYMAIYNKWSQQLKTVKLNRRNYLSKADVESLTVYVDIMENINDIICKHVGQHKLELKEAKLLFNRFDLLLTPLQDRGDFISAQEVGDINLELLRFIRLTQLCIIQSSDNFRSMRTKTEVEKPYREAYTLANSIERYSNDYDARVKKALDDLRIAVKSSPVTEAERKEIVRAMDFSQGHWFKCPNGHYYAIGECGGAMEESKCVDCGAPVGGQNHRLLSSNQLASEIDGATRHAYPGGLYAM